MSQDIYQVIRARRDVRSQFVDKPMDPEVLGRILAAAHAAPSVGLSEPWDFVIVRSRKKRQLFKQHVEREREIFAGTLNGERKELFAKIKIEGIMEAALGVVVTYDPNRGAPSVLGRHAISDAGLYSVCLAIENLWLAAAAEGIGVGWVSFYREEFLAKLVNLEPGIRPVAWLCIGPVSHLEDRPDLERFGWRFRSPLSDHVFLDEYGEADRAAIAELVVPPAS